MYKKKEYIVGRLKRQREKLSKKYFVQLFIIGFYMYYMMLVIYVYV